MGIEAIIERRRAEREALILRARELIAGVRGDLQVVAAVVFGSVARGDFNLWSDVDVLVLAPSLPERWDRRAAMLGDTPAGVSAFAWTISEWRERLRKKDPIATEACALGVWLRGSPEVLR